MNRLLLIIPLLAGAALAWPLLRAADPEHAAAAPKTAAQAGTNAFHNIGVQEFEKLRSATNNVVLDVRTPKEFAAGHIPGATNIDVNAPDFDKKVRALDRNKTYLVHCAAGVRSAKACEKLSKLSFGHLYNLTGGFKAWEKQASPSHR
jgi:rhodanese-related sulfurtransferase